MEYNQQGKKPLLTPIKNGWAAHGDGWAVHGRTQEEALENYHKAEERHREIDARPLLSERFEAHSTPEERYA